MSNLLKHISAESVHWFQEEQQDERLGSFGDPIADFTESFSVEGWRIAEGCVDGYAVKNGDAERAIAERKALVALWEKDQRDFVLFRIGDDKANSSFRALAAFAKAQWTDSKGKWIVPTHIGVTGNRRGFAVMASLLAYQQRNQVKKNFTIPVLVKDYPSEQAKFDDRIRENARVGQKGYSIIGQLSIAVKAVKYGYSESELEVKLNVKRGAAQKLHAWALIINKYPELDLLKRALLDKPKDDKGAVITTPPWPYDPKGWYPFSSVNAAAGRTILGRVKEVDKMDPDCKAVGITVPNTIATAEQVEEYLKILVTGRSSADKMMKRSTLQTIVSGLPAGPLCDLLAAILKDDREALCAARDLLIK